MGRRYAELQMKPTSQNVAQRISGYLMLSLTLT